MKAEEITQENRKREREAEAFGEDMGQTEKDGE